MHYEGRTEHGVILRDSKLIIFSEENTSFDLCREICGLGSAESKPHLLFPSFRRALGFGIFHLRYIYLRDKYMYCIKLLEGRPLLCGERS